MLIESRFWGINGTRIVRITTRCPITHGHLNRCPRLIPHSQRGHACLGYVLSLEAKVSLTELICTTSACIAIWMTTTWTLAASGSWKNKWQEAWDWTRWAFAGTFWSSFFIFIAVSIRLPSHLSKRKAHEAVDVVGTGHWRGRSREEQSRGCGRI